MEGESDNSDNIMYVVTFDRNTYRVWSQPSEIRQKAEELWHEYVKYYRRKSGMRVNREDDGKLVFKIQVGYDDPMKY